jgi:hypothetical protein
MCMCTIGHDAARVIHELHAVEAGEELEKAAGHA